MMQLRLNGKTLHLQMVGRLPVVQLRVDWIMKSLMIVVKFIRNSTICRLVTTVWFTMASIVEGISLLQLWPAATAQRKCWTQRYIWKEKSQSGTISWLPFSTMFRNISIRVAIKYCRILCSRTNIKICCTIVLSMMLPVQRLLLKMENMKVTSVSV